MLVCFPPSTDENQKRSQSSDPKMTKGTKSSAEVSNDQSENEAKDFGNKFSEGVFNYQSGAGANSFCDKTSQLRDENQPFWGTAFPRTALLHDPAISNDLQGGQSLGRTPVALSISARLTPVGLPRHGFSSDWGAFTGPDYLAPVNVSRHGLLDDNEASALFLSDPEVIIGSRFLDLELGWCRVTGWGIYTGPSRKISIILLCS
jgi:hypothetical protein